MCLSVLLPLSICGLVSFKLSNTKCQRGADSAAAVCCEGEVSGETRALRFLNDLRVPPDADLPGANQMRGADEAAAIGKLPRSASVGLAWAARRTTCEERS